MCENLYITHYCGSHIYEKKPIEYDYLYQRYTEALNFGLYLKLSSLYILIRASL